MRYALAVNTVTADVRVNVRGIIGKIAEAGRNGADMIILPETAVTGFINTGDHDHDLGLGLDSGSGILRAIAGQARASGVYVSVGLFEAEHGRLYDSVFFIDPNGDVIARYRRITDGWHGNGADRGVCREGNDLVDFRANGLSHTCLVCGDLFDDGLVKRVRELHADVLIVPFARTFKGGTPTQGRWETEEMPFYTEQVVKAGTTALMVNYLSPPGPDRYFGGAFAVDAYGTVMAQMDILRDGMMYVAV